MNIISLFIALFLLICSCKGPIIMNIKGKMESGKSLTFYYGDDYSAFSLSPYDSDALSNLIFMEQLVGTLIKYSSNGHYGPFLADSWSLSSNQLSWRFNIRKNSVSEKGTLIIPSTFVHSLALSMKYYSQRGKVPVFEKLEGWDDFVEGKVSAPSGLVADDQRNQLIFNFREPVIGLMEYLAMPYYGFIEESDRDKETGEWKDKKKITSSGAYQVEEMEMGKKKSLAIILRKNFFSALPHSPYRVLFKNEDFSSAIQDHKTSIILKRLNKEDQIPDSFNLLKGTPTVLVSMVLSPFRANSFKHQSIRQLFNRSVKKLEKEIPFSSYVSERSIDFYPVNPSLSGRKMFQDELSVEEKQLLVNNLDQELSVVLTRSLSDDELAYLHQLFKKMSDEYGVKFHIINEDRSDPDFFQKITSNQFYDIRIAKVDIGGQVDEFIIGMMFCSKLGVGFPDLEGNICRLVEEQLKVKRPLGLFSQQFNELYIKESCVLPLWHTGLTWLLSKDIKLSSITSTMGIPRFDTLEIEQ